MDGIVRGARKKKFGETPGGGAPDQKHATTGILSTGRASRRPEQHDMFLVFFSPCRPVVAISILE